MTAFKREPQRITSWSPSRLSAYEECPRKAKYKFIDKLPEPESPALVRGAEIHAAAEEYITGRAAKLHGELGHAKVQKLLGALRSDYKKQRVRVELELAFTRAWTLCSWLSRDVYARFKVDVLWLATKQQALVIDWKTGKFRPEDSHYDSQLNAYVVAVLSAGLTNSATAQLVFTDAGQLVERGSGTLQRAQLPAAQKEWDRRAAPMLSDTKFTAHPGNGCRWCPFSANRGGPCKF